MKTSKLKIEVPKVELKQLTFNAKKWRKENGYITPEWEMYVKNVICTMTIFCTISLILGILIGKVFL